MRPRRRPRVGFAWLAKPDGMNVFIPVLLGAGALLSAVAWAVERLARATAGRAAERGLAGQLAALDLPAGRPPRRRGRSARPPPRTNAMKRAMATVALLAALGVGIVVMADATQNRPDVRPAGSITTVDFTVSTRDYQRGETAAATALWAVCSATIGGTVSPSSRAGR